MKYRYDLHGLGREIRNTVRNAVRPEDVQHLQGSIDDIMRELSDMGRELSRPLGAPETEREPRASRKKSGTVKGEAQRQHQDYVYNNKPVPITGKSPKSINGIVLTVLGSIFAGFSTVMGIAFIAASLVGKALPLPGANATVAIVGWMFALSVGASTFMLSKGSSLRKRVKRYAEYLRLFSGCKLYPVEQLSIVMDRSKNCVLRDLRRMIRTGKLPGAHLDVQRTTIILDEETYEQYLQTEQRRRVLATSDKKAKPQPIPETAAAPTPPPADLSPIAALVGEGRAYIDRINATNPIIGNGEVSRKIDLIAATVSKIFDYVAEHPEKQGDLRRLMSYYLPTTLKLLEAYSKFEAHAVRGENVTTAMHEIEGALDTISHAFENLLDDLFEHEMYDITSDISALEAVLAQEGLTAQSFATQEPKNTAGGLQ